MSILKKGSISKHTITKVSCSPAKKRGLGRLPLSLQPLHTLALALRKTVMKKILVLSSLGIAIGAFLCGVLLYKYVYPKYIYGQTAIEKIIDEKAEKIRTGELKLEPSEFANLLIAAGDRSAEKQVVRHYLWIAIIFVSASLFLYILGLYVGLREQTKLVTKKSGS